MGTFTVPMIVRNLTTGASITVDAFVDTGASLPVLPGSLLRQIGVEPVSQQAFELADGSRVEYPVGEVRITVEGRTVPTLCVFGPEGSTPLLGVVVLELAGLTVDPRERRLVPTPGLLL